MGGRYSFDFINRPGIRLNRAEFEKLTAELDDIESACSMRRSGCITRMDGNRSAVDSVVTTARKKDGSAIGFSEALIVPVESVGNVLHIVRTFVKPEYRGEGISHELTSRLVIGFMLGTASMSGIWVSSCTNVLSALGGFALNFDHVYPSPLSTSKPGRHHMSIANTVSTGTRELFGINPEATFDPLSFVFAGGAGRSEVQSAADDYRFHHRENLLNRYYRNIMNTDGCDFVLQVGKASALSALMYFLGRRGMPTGLYRHEMIPERGLV